jgi:hypothetical protein
MEETYGYCEGRGKAAKEAPFLVSPALQSQEAMK